MSVLKTFAMPMFYAWVILRGVNRDTYRLEVAGLVKGAPVAFGLSVR